MPGKVTVWQMTEEERLAYIEKHPIRPTKKGKRNEPFENIHKDFKWRGDKGAESRWNEN